MRGFQRWEERKEWWADAKTWQETRAKFAASIGDSRKTSHIAALLYETGALEGFREWYRLITGRVLDGPQTKERYIGAIFGVAPGTVLSAVYRNQATSQATTKGDHVPTAYLQPAPDQASRPMGSFWSSAPVWKETNAGTPRRRNRLRSLEERQEEWERERSAFWSCTRNGIRQTTEDQAAEN
jgi:hypothetical protein